MAEHCRQKLLRKNNQNTIRLITMCKKLCEFTASNDW